MILALSDTAASTAANGPCGARKARLRAGLSGLTLAFLLSACATSAQDASPTDALGVMSEAPQGPDMFFQRPEDYVAQVAYWGDLYDHDPRDREAALNYGRNLRYVKRTKDAVAVLSKAVVTHSDDTLLLAEYGKALTAAGRTTEGAAYLARANEQQDGNWVTLSAQGVALDQLGDHEQASAKYEQALSASPGNPMILNNLALSRALAGDLAAAERHLRDAVITPQANAQIRQNLALVLGLKGDFAEARRYAGVDLPLAVVEENMATLKRLRAEQPSPWSQLQALDLAQ